ncbi:MAG: hypothetical protein J6V80_02160 [Clostridia bacterium]|nr:hypothetical protein [Clostridia bacterium]
MKKILSLVLVALLCFTVLTGCAAINGAVDTVKGWFGLGGADQGLTDAAVLLHGIYKDKSEATSVDFDVVAQVVVDGVKYPVTWTSDNDKVVIRESTKAGFYTVDLPDVNTEEFTYTLTATISDAKGNTEQKSYTFKMLVVNNEAVVNELVEGVAYKMFLLQGNKGQRFYALNTTQNNENKFINTTLDPKAAVEFFVEKADGGYKWYTLVDGVKTYVYAKTTESDGKISKYIGFSTEEGTVFTYDRDMGGVWTTTINGTVYGVGTYNSFTTISLSEGTFFSVDTIGSTQFVLQFITAEEANKLSPDPEKEGPQLPVANSTLTIEEAIAVGKLFTKDSYTTGKYYVTGEIVKITSDVYGNMDIKDANGNTISIYGSYDATGANRFDAMETKPQVGDTITIYGIIGMYNAPQIKNGWIVAINGENLGGTPSTGDYALLDLMGNANLVSGSGEQNVFAANGITFTNDKASSTSALTVQASYAQRAYAGSTVKIEYPGMTKIVITFDDYSPDGTKTYMTGFDGMTVEGATFSRANDVLTITFAAATDVFQSTTLTSQVRIEKIEVYTGEVENPGEGGGEVTPPAGETPTYTAPEEGKAYLLYLEQVNLNKTLYFNGKTSDGRFLTTEDKNAAVEIYFEAVDGGYRIYVMIDGAKNYVNTAPYIKDNQYIRCRLALEATPNCVWTYDANLGILEANAELEGKSDTFFFGTYDTYNTISLSGTYYKSQITSGTQFPARLVLAEGGEVTPPAHEHNFVDGSCSCGATDPNYQPPAGGEGNEGNEGNEGTETGVMTIPQVLASAEGTAVVVKGTVSEIYQAWSDQFNNISFYIKDDAGNKLLVFRTGTLVSIGDQVTVTGTATLYNNVIQIAQGGTTVIDAKHVCSDYEAADCLNAASCKVCGAANGSALGHNYVNGTCDRCGAVEVSGTITASKTMAELITELGWTSSTTKQSFNLDDNVSVKIDGGSNTGKAYNGDHIRIYATDTPAGTITISVAAGYELVSIKVTTQTGTYAFLCVDGSDADISNETVSVSGSSVVLNSVKNGGDGKQVRVMAIEVVYASAN